MPNYSHITKFFEENVVYRKPKSIRGNVDWYNLYKNDLDNDPVFKIIKKHFPIENIYYRNLESFSNKHNPNKFRLRGDSFLKLAIKHKLDKTFIMFSCVKVNGIKTYIVLTSNHFCNYSNSTESSNSYLTKDFNNLVNWSLHEGDYSLNQRRTKRGLVTTYIFWHGNENNLDSLENYLTVLSNIPTDGYQFVRSSSPNNPSIPVSISNEIYKRYNNECALKTLNRCLTQNSNTNDISKEIHHIVTRDYLRDRKIFKSEIVNNQNNLILLCFKCHDQFSNKNKVKEYLINLIEVLKVKKLYSNFENYLLNELNITIPILFKIYGVSYE